MSCIVTGTEGERGASTFFGPPKNPGDASTAFNDECYIDGDVSEKIKINDIILYFKNNTFTSYKVYDIDSSSGSKIKASVIDRITLSLQE